MQKILSFFSDITISKRLIVFFMFVGLVPLATIGILAYVQASSALNMASFNTLIAVREIKKNQIEKFFAERNGDMNVLAETVATLRLESFNKLKAVQAIKASQISGYFGERLADASVLSTNDEIVSALQAYDKAFSAEGNRTGGRQWRATDSRYGTWLTQYKEEYGYYDLFLISRDGDVVYSVTAESDLGANLVRGELRTSSLGLCFAEALKGTAISDFKPYAPSAGEPAAFVGAPVTSGGRTIGVVVMQLPLGAINKIMQERAGMGVTGECYLVGSDMFMRSDSYLDPEGHSVNASMNGTVEANGVNTEAVREGLAGNSGADVILDYNNNPVLSVWSPVKVGELTWIAIAEIDVAEAFSPVDEEGVAFYNKYVAEYGYYDLFLINPDGYVFFTAFHEPDYQTNMVDGRFKDSNLGVLTRRVLSDKEFGMVDFAPYEPSNGTPAAFIAAPTLSNGAVEMVVALQISLESINDIMTERSGMGETGESYLVGADKLMRSDSFLDPENHTVAASFANPELGSVDTDAANDALKGNVDAKIIIDYNGNPVLSAYTPIDVFGIKWVLLAEIDEAEAFAATFSLRNWTIIIALVIAGAVIGIALVVAKNIVTPINSAIVMLKDIEEGEGDLTKRLNLTAKDEIGIMGGLFDSFIAKVQELMKQIGTSSEQVGNASDQISSASEQMAAGAEEQQAQLSEVATTMEQMSAMIMEASKNANETRDTAQKTGNTA
ncbi:MAG: methyl-accepting chemotaxis protein, partial [Candidatus Neomarinimicrobiota bacterium]